MIILAVFIRYFRFWIQSKTTGASISIFDLLGMTFRKVNPAVIVRSKIMAVQAGISERDGVTSPAAWKPITWPVATCRWSSGHPLPPRGQLRNWTSSLPRPSTWPAGTCWRPWRERQSQGDRLPPRGAAGANPRRHREERHPDEGQGPRHGPRKPESN